jgi:phospholipase/lecithinase/hemolysin
MGELIMKIRVALATFSVLLFTGGSAWAATFSSLYTFGDSLSDIGDSPSAATSIYKLLGDNCDPSHPCGPYFHGRLSNGPVATEYLAGSLFPGGVNSTNFRSYSVGGATSGVGNIGDGGSATEPGGFNIPGINLKPLPGMQQEVERYMSDSGGVADPNALYVVWGGSDDYLTHDSPVGAAQNIGSYVSTLAAAGARNFLVPNSGDLGHTPEARSNDDVAQAQAYSIVFNNELATQLGSVHSNFPAADIRQFDTYSFLNNIIQDPAAFGFTNVTNACVSLLILSCDNPETHLYWDSVHPTTLAHSLLGAAFATTVTSAVPEPEIFSMLVAGLFLLGIGGYRRSGRVEPASGVFHRESAA